jgi:hypothetical protein
MATETLIYRKERRSARLRTELRVRYGVESLDHVEQAQNICEGGLYIATNRVLEVGTRIQLAIAFPDQEPLLAGEVVWAIQVPEHLRQSVVYGMGIRFVDPHPAWPECFRRWKEAQPDHSPK